MIDDNLKQFANPTQLKYLTAIKQHGSHRKAAKVLGCSPQAIDKSMRRLRKAASNRGYAPEYGLTNTLPEGMQVNGLTLRYDANGKLATHYVKAKAIDENKQALHEAIVNTLTDQFRGLSPIVKPPKVSDADLLAVYPLGDPHFGLLSWEKETGANFNLSEARRLTIAAIDRLISVSPDAETAILLPLGDVTHVNDQTNVTPGHKHQLDTDSRFVRILEVTIESFRHVILRLLEKHKKVVVRFVPGNHDPQAIWAIAFSIANYFANNERVFVDLSPGKHWYYKHGKVLIGSTHGDTAKKEKLAGMMACDRAQEWGATKWRYWYCGHIHSSTVTEEAGCLIETFRTLAAPDSFSNSYGYRAGRDARCIVLHAERGETERHICDVSAIQ